MARIYVREPFFGQHGGDWEHLLDGRIDLVDGKIDLPSRTVCKIVSQKPEAAALEKLLDVCRRANGDGESQMDFKFDIGHRGPYDRIDHILMTGRINRISDLGADAIYDVRKGQIEIELSGLASYEYVPDYNKCPDFWQYNFEHWMKVKFYMEGKSDALSAADLLEGLTKLGSPEYLLYREGQYHTPAFFQRNRLPVSDELVDAGIYFGILRPTSGGEHIPMPMDELKVDYDGFARAQKESAS